MKFSLLSAAGIIAAVSQASAVTIVTPWANSVWTAGAHGDITWNTTAADATLKCDIYLLNGDYKNSNIVAQVTNPATPVDCSVGKFDIYPLGDFASGNYWIRIGQSSTGAWAYSGVFKFQGNGTSSPVSVVGTPSAAVNGTNPGAAVASASGASTTALPTAAANKNSTSSASASASASSTAKSGADSAMSVNTAAVALGAIAAIAFAL
ncbi:unnamed protein product [Mucor hiemalis]